MADCCIRSPNPTYQISLIHTIMTDDIICKRKIRTPKQERLLNRSCSPVTMMNLSCVQRLSKLPNYLVPVTFPGSFSFSRNHQATIPSKTSSDFRSYKDGKLVNRKGGIVRGWLLPVDPWAPNIDSQSIASQLFAVSLFPYIGFLYFITKSKSAPKLTLFGFYFLLAFVGATIPAGIYGAESLLTLTNLFIVLGLRQALRKTEDAKESASNSVPDGKKQKKPYI